MVTYKRTSHEAQAKADVDWDLGDPEICTPLDLGEDPTVAEALRMGRQEIHDLTFSELRRHICLDYELGCVSARDTMKRLHDQGLYGSPETFITIFSAGVRALAEMAVSDDPEPPDVPSSYADPRLLETLAEARGRAA